MRDHSIVASSEKAEKVVKPPSRPVTNNYCAWPSASAPAMAPMGQLPMALTACVPQGKAGPFNDGDGDELAQDGAGRAAERHDQP